jgi:hypothetical protein
MPKPIAMQQAAIPKHSLPYWYSNTKPITWQALALPVVRKKCLEWRLTVMYLKNSLKLFWLHIKSLTG